MKVGNFLLKLHSKSKSIHLEYNIIKYLYGYTFIYSKKKHLYLYNEWAVQKCEKGVAMYVCKGNECMMCALSETKENFLYDCSRIDKMSKEFLDKFWYRYSGACLER